MNTSITTYNNESIVEIDGKRFHINSPYISVVGNKIYVKNKLYADLDNPEGLKLAEKSWFERFIDYLNQKLSCIFE